MKLIGEYATRDSNVIGVFAQEKLERGCRERGAYYALKLVERVLSVVECLSLTYIVYV